MQERQFSPAYSKVWFLLPFLRLDYSRSGRGLTVNRLMVKSSLWTLQSTTKFQIKIVAMRVRLTSLRALLEWGSCLTCVCPIYESSEFFFMKCHCGNTSVVEISTLLKTLPWETYDLWCNIKEYQVPSTEVKHFTLLLSEVNFTN